MSAANQLRGVLRSAARPRRALSKAPGRVTVNTGFERTTVFVSAIQGPSFLRTFLPLSVLRVVQVVTAQATATIGHMMRGAHQPFMVLFSAASSTSDALGSSSR